MLTLFILVATSLVTFIIYELLTSIDSDNLVNLNTNNVVVNNHMSIREVKNATANLSSNFVESTNNNVSSVFNNGNTGPSGWIIAVSALGAVLVAGTLIGVSLYFLGGYPILIK